MGPIQAAKFMNFSNSCVLCIHRSFSRATLSDGRYGTGVAIGESHDDDVLSPVRNPRRGGVTSATSRSTGLVTSTGVASRVMESSEGGGRRTRRSMGARHSLGARSDMSVEDDEGEEGADEDDEDDSTVQLKPVDLSDPVWEPAASMRVRVTLGNYSR